MLNFISVKQMKGWLMALALLISAVSTISPVFAQSPAEATLTVVATALNVRRGPDVSQPAFDVLLVGEQVTVVVYDAAADWWQVELPDGQMGWVSGGPQYVSVNGEVSTSSPMPTNQTPPATNTSAATETIIFQTVSGGAIYAINPDGSQLRYLTSGFDPALSPDGQWVAFTRWEDTQNGALGDLWVIKVDGSGERAVLGQLHQPKAPVWSPDGRQIIIGMQHGGRLFPEERCSSRPPAGAFDVELHPEPDGSREFCYIILADPYWGLRIIDMATGTYEDLPNQHFSFSPAWDLANPSHIVYDGDRGLVNLDLRQGNAWPLTYDVQDHSPVFSPDGSKIAVSYRQTDHWEIHVLNADGTGRVRLTATSYRTLVEQHLNGETSRSFNNAAPTWSPDGTQLAFLTDRTGQYPEGIVWEIWVMQADGSNQRPLFSIGTLAGIPLQYNGVDERMLSWR